MTAICIVSPLPRLGRDCLEVAGYQYIQTRPPVIEQPMMDMPLEQYTLEIARRYTNPPSSNVISIGECIMPESTIRIVLGCHSSVVYSRSTNEWVDRIVTCPDQKREILCKGNNRPWKVVTGYVLIDLFTEKAATHIETTDVQISRLTEAEIEGYIHREETGYAIGGLYIKGRGALFVSCIEGSYFNALGCSPHIVKSMLRQVGVDDICYSR